MTVSELIEKLNTLPPDAVAIVEGDEWSGCLSVGDEILLDEKGI